MSEDMRPDEQNDADEADREHATKANQMVRRGFDGLTLAHENGATQALIAKQTADIQARWVMAMRRPRNMADVRQLIRREVERPGFAQAAIYSVPRGGSTIQGLTIRFAEVAMRCMSNMSCESQTLYDSDEERLVRVTVVDFESNVTWNKDITIKKTVERKFLKKGQRPIRSRINSNGDQVHIVEATDDDVMTKEAAQISKASRTGILRLIPGHIQDEAFDRCVEIQKTNATKDPEGERNRMFDAFAMLGIMPTHIEEYLGHTVDQVSPAELVKLRGVFVAIQQGETSWSDQVEGSRDRAKSDKPAAPSSSPAPAPPVTESKPPATGKGTAAVKDKLASKPASPTPAAPASTPATAPAEKPASKPAPASGLTLSVQDQPTPITKPPGTAAPANDTGPAIRVRKCEMCGDEVEVPGNYDGPVHCQQCVNA